MAGSRRPGTSGYRPTVGVSGQRSWIQVPLTWPLALVMVLWAVTRWLIRWRIELACSAVVLLAFRWLAPHVGGWRWAFGILVVLVAAVAVWPASRVWLVARCWSMFSRHRIRTALGQAGVSSREGHLPWVMFTRRTPVGTRVTVWMRSGTAMEQMGQDDSVKMGIIRSACWAREVRIERHPRWAHVVSVHLVRYDTLAPGVQVASTLPDLLKAITRLPAQRQDSTTDQAA